MLVSQRVSSHFPWVNSEPRKGDGDQTCQLVVQPIAKKVDHSVENCKKSAAILLDLELTWTCVGPYFSERPVARHEGNHNPLRQFISNPRKPFRSYILNISKHGFDWNTCVNKPIPSTSIIQQLLTLA